jgi:hypothetical protein
MTKSEIRSPKEARNPKPEKGRAVRAGQAFGFRYLAFLRISVFGFRVSSLARHLLFARR